MRRKQLLGSLGILLATIFWGFSFVVTKDTLNRFSVLHLSAFKYLIAAAGMGMFFSKRLKGMTRIVLKEGAVLGGLLFVSQYFQTLGCKYTTAGKNAFITGFYVVLVPFLAWLVYRKKTEERNIIAAVLAIVGIGLLSLQGSMKMQKGDWITMISSVGLAFHIIKIEQYTKEHDPVLLTMIQFFFAALFSWITVFVLGKPVLGQIPWMELLYLGIFSTMLGFLLQIVGQSCINQNLAAVLLSTESIFGLLFSVILLGEILTGKMLIGCVCMLAAILISELDVSHFYCMKKPNN